MHKYTKSRHYTDEHIIEQVNYFIMCLTQKPDSVQALLSLTKMMHAHLFYVAVNKDNGNILLRFEFDGSSKADLVIISYVPASDTFSLIFSKQDRFGNFMQYHEIDGLFFEDLRAVFYQYTGLETNFPKIMLATPNIEFIRIGDRA